MNTTTIQLAGRPATLTFDKHARFRYGVFGLSFSGLLEAGTDYAASLILIWAALPDAERETYPTPESLVDVIDTDATEIFEPVFQTVYAIGWLTAAPTLARK
jgi:hypothetical protein